MNIIIKIRILITIKIIIIKEMIKIIVKFKNLDKKYLLEEELNLLTEIQIVDVNSQKIAFLQEIILKIITHTLIIKIIIEID